jgi:fructooligosaccharide transport system permease protein
MNKKKLSMLVGYILLAILAFLFIFPLLWMISSSMKPEANIYTEMGSIKALLPSFTVSDWFAAYKSLFARFNIFGYVSNSLFYAAVVALGAIFVNALAGYAFAKYEFKGKKLIFLMLLALLIIPTEALIINQFTVIHKIGLVNTRIAVMLPLFANVFFIYLFRNFFMAVPDSIIESARLEGASSWKIFWSIMMPMSKPAIATVGTLAFIASWNDYIWPLMILTDSDKYPLQVAITNINSTNPVYTNEVMAILTVSTIPLIIVYIFAQKFLMQGLGNSGTGDK